MSEPITRTEELFMLLNQAEAEAEQSSEKEILLTAQEPHQRRSTFRTSDADLMLSKPDNFLQVRT